MPNLTPVRNIDPHNVGPPVRSWFITPHEHYGYSVFFGIYSVSCAPSEARSNEAELKFWRQPLAMEEASGKVALGGNL